MPLKKTASSPPSTAGCRLNSWSASPLRSAVNLSNFLVDDHLLIRFNTGLQRALSRRPRSGGVSARRQFMEPKLKASAILLAVMLSLAIGATAQEVTGTIAGTVTDSTGAVLPNATVTVTNIEKNAVIRSLVTGSSGEYAAALLPIGHYTVEVNAPGFKLFNKTNIELNVNDHLTVNARLVAGNVNEVVNVEAEALQVDTQSSAATGLITGTQVRELALKSRNYEELVALMPGVTTDVGDNLYVGVSAPSGGT